MHTKAITLDIEGDASASQCRTLFPDANHFDKNTIPWCITFCNSFSNSISDNASDSAICAVTYVCKLPNHAREYIVNEQKSGIFTKTYHLDSTKIPVGKYSFTYDNESYSSNIVECKSVKELMMKASLILQVCKSKNITCYCKPFYDHLYDAELLSVRFDDYSIDKECLSVIKPYHCFIESYKQANQLCDNQTFMNNGIRHNIVDCVKLYRTFRKNVCT